MPQTVPARILVGGAVRKRPSLLHASLDSLARQILPPYTQLDFAFVDDNVDPASTEVLQTWLAERNGRYLDGRSNAPDFAEGPQTHQWSGDAMRRVGAFKNQLIKEAIAGNYDGLWLLDTDLILGPRTFWSLWWSEKPIACAVFWTKWQNTRDCPPLPQVWLRHPYEFSGRGMDQSEFLRLLTERQLVQVWGQGACTLYRRDTLLKGLSFDLVPEVPLEGMMQGEDRHLCIRAERLHVPMYADAWPDLLHVYHEFQEAQIPAFVATPEADGPPSLGSLVSIQVQALEPVRNSANEWVMLDRQHVRGRLGRLPLVPDLEQAVTTLQRGETRSVSVEFPTWSECAAYRGQRRLLDVTLVDHKPDQPPPCLS